MRHSQPPTSCAAPTPAPSARPATPRERHGPAARSRPRRTSTPAAHEGSPGDPRHGPSPHLAVGLRPAPGADGRTADARGTRPSRHPVRMRNDGRFGDLVKVIWFDGQGSCLFSKRLERGRFVWPSATEGKVAMTPAEMAMLLEGIDWRTPARAWRPRRAGQDRLIKRLGITTRISPCYDRPGSTRPPRCPTIPVTSRRSRGCRSPKSRRRRP